MVDVLDGHAGILHHRVERRLGALEEVLGQILELRPGEGFVEVDRTVLAHREVLQRDVGARRGRELLLRLLSGFLEALHRRRVLRQVDAVVVLDLLDQPIDDPLIPVVTAEAVVTGGRTDLNGREAVIVLADFEQRDVERTAAEVEDEDELVFLAALEAVGQSSSGGLVDDAQDVEAGDLTGVLRGLALCVVEVGRHGDDRVGDLLLQVLLSVVLELLEDAGGDLGSGQRLAADLGVPVGAHVALDGRHGVLHVGDSLALGDLADQGVSVLVDCDDGRGRATAFHVRDDLGVAALEDSDNGVRGSEVDSNCTCHIVSP